MYYEETIIDGVLYFRTSPTENFSPKTKRQLTEEITRLRKVLAEKEMEKASQIMSSF